MEGEKKSVYVIFWLTRRSRVREEKKKKKKKEREREREKKREKKKRSVLGHPIARATSYYILITGLQKCIWQCKTGSVKFARSLSLPSIVKKVRPGCKKSQGT